MQNLTAGLKADLEKVKSELFSAQTLSATESIEQDKELDDLRNLLQKCEIDKEELRLTALSERARLEKQIKRLESFQSNSPPQPIPPLSPAGGILFRTLGF